MDYVSTWMGDRQVLDQLWDVSELEFLCVNRTETTTCVSDGFAPMLGDRNTFQPSFFLFPESMNCGIAE